MSVKFKDLKLFGFRSHLIFDPFLPNIKGNQNIGDAFTTNEDTLVIIVLPPLAKFVGDSPLEMGGVWVKAHLELLKITIDPKLLPRAIYVPEIFNDESIDHIKSILESPEKFLKEDPYAPKEV